MKIVNLGVSLLLIGFCVACGFAKSPTNKEPATVAAWIAKRNAKREPCKADFGSGGGSDGYDTFTYSCVGGYVVYVDTTAETQMREAEESAHKQYLSDALVSRCLTTKEFSEVTHLTYNLYTRNMQPYNEEELRARFIAELQIQQILRSNCPK